MKLPEGLRGLVAAIGASLAALSLALSPVATRNATAQVDAPALWRVDGPKGRVFLFGSFHLLPADVKWRTPAVEKTAVELGVPPPSLEPLRPWLAALTLGMQLIVSQGFDPNHGVEQQVLWWARANGKSLGALETNESQLRVFADLTREEETALLTVSLRQVREMPKILEEMLTAYRKGDLATLERTLNIGLEDFPMLRKRLLKDRHDKWLPQIEKMIADGRSYMIIVGDAHLVGPDSVIAMLRAKGVKVEGP